MNPKEKKPTWGFDMVMVKPKKEANADFKQSTMTVNQARRYLHDRDHTLYRIYYIDYLYQGTRRTNRGQYLITFNDLIT